MKNTEVQVDLYEVKNKENQIELPHFEVESVTSEVNEIPAGVNLINAPLAWGRSEQGKDIVVAVLDTGCQTDHLDLKDRIIGGRNFSTDHNSAPDNYSDLNGHGTHVAGTIAATQNLQGVLGVAPKAKLLIVKVLNGEGSGTYEGIINGINYAVNWKGPNNETVRVISMSLGGPEDVRELHEAVKNAVIEKNILVVCAAGNSGDGELGTDEVSYPGSYQEVVQVGSVDLNKYRSRFSNSNKNVDLVAPGENILSTYINGKYARLTGTSMATPHVSGAAALIIKQCEREEEFGRTLSEAEIYAQLIKRTDSLAYSKRYVGNGIVNLAKV